MAKSSLDETNAHVLPAGGGAVIPFLVGAAVGGLAGAVAGALLSGHAAHLIATVLGVVDRRGPSRDDDHPKFELLLQ